MVRPRAVAARGRSLEAAFEMVAPRFPSLLRMNCAALATAAVGKALPPTLARQAACPTGWQAALARGQPSLLLPFAAGIPAVLPVDLAGHATADSNAIDVRSTRRFSRTCANPVARAWVVKGCGSCAITPPDHFFSRPRTIIHTTPPPTHSGRFPMAGVGTAS